MRKQGRRQWVVAVSVGLSLVASSASARDYAGDLGWGTLAMLSNVAYAPAKLVYAVAGGVTGSLAYGLTLGNFDTAENIWHPTLGGSYILTPAMLQGREPVHFSPARGSDDEVRRRRRIEE